MAKKYLDENGVLYFWQKIKSKLSEKANTSDLNNYVAKEDGKGLSTNDYTTTEKEKLAGLKNYTLPTASASQLGGVKVGAGLAISNGVLSATGGGTADSVDWSNVQNRPTKVSDFPNDSGYQTEAQVNAIVEGVIGSAPDALDTLEELSKALGEDPNFATTITTELAKKVDESDLIAITNAEIDTVVAS